VVPQIHNHIEEIIMKGTRLPLPSSRMLVAALILFIATFVAASTRASAVLTITNNTKCPAFICATNGGGTTLCATIPANSSSVINLSCPLPIVSITVCGNTLPVPPGGCLTNLLLNGTCCADVCFNDVRCLLTIDPVAGPCTC
jgi:hypothetical protein